MCFGGRHTRKRSEFPQAKKPIINKEPCIADSDHYIHSHPIQARSNLLISWRVLKSQLQEQYVVSILSNILPKVTSAWSLEVPGIKPPTSD